MKFKKILVYNIDKTKNLDLNTWKKIESLGGKIVFLPKDDPKLQKELFDTDCVLVNFGTDFSKKEIESASNLKYIGVMAVAFGKIDVEYAGKKKIIVANLKGYCTDSVAEFVIASILEYARGLEEGKKRGRVGNYSEMGIPTFELKRKTLGVVGLGAIGQAVAKIAQAFGAEVIYWSKHRKKYAEKNGIKYSTLKTLISSSDIVSINLAQTKETEGLFNSSLFKKLKKGAMVINTAPMELVNIDALIARLKLNDITFILDHSDEMTKADLKKISKYSNCIIYPPMAYISREAAENKKKMFVDNIEAFLKGRPQNVVS